MDQRLLGYYNRELLYVREMGGEFAKEFPKIAGRLGLDGFECADPYVERLIESFAFLAARIHLKLDLEFPKFTDHLMEIVYPQYLAPIPSLAILQLTPDREEGSLVDGFEIPRDTSVRSLLGPGDQTSCEYRTSQKVTLWPIELVEASYDSRDSVSNRLPASCQNARSVLRLKLRTFGGIPFKKVGLDRLTIHLRGKDARSFKLYEQVFADAMSVLVGTPGQVPAAAAGSIDPVGFSPEEALFPDCPRTFEGYRLLTEYYAFQQRFMFFELTGLRSSIAKCESNEIEILIPFRRIDTSLENVVDVQNFGLFCTPAINLFPMRADRIHVDDGETEYHVVPDRTRPLDFEVHSVTSVLGYDKSLDSVSPFAAFYDLTDEEIHEAELNQKYFTLRRTYRKLSHRQKRRGPRTSYVGSEVFITIVDGRNAPYSKDLGQLDLRLLCTNRDLPLMMPIGKKESDFNLDTGAPVKTIRCIAGPTEPMPSLASISGERSWRLINHLSLNYLSLVDSEGRGAAALRELLGLYQFDHADERQQQDGLVSVNTKEIYRRLTRSGPITYGRGLQIDLTFDENLMEGSSAFLLGSVLSRFFSKYVTINSFTQTVLKTLERGEVMKWPATIGKRQTL